MTFYLCDLEDHCKNSPGCFRCGGECRHTTNVGHAVYGECKHPEKEPDRFEVETFETVGRATAYYWEKERGNAKKEDKA